MQVASSRTQDHDLKDGADAEQEDLHKLRQMRTRELS
jgi:hypothetical protein